MRQITLGLLTLTLLSMPEFLTAQQQHSTQTSPSPSDPTKNNPDVPHQAPNTNNPDMAPQNQPAPGGTSSTSTSTSSKPAKTKHRRKSSRTTGDTAR